MIRFLARFCVAGALVMFATTGSAQPLAEGAVAGRASDEAGHPIVTVGVTVTGDLVTGIRTTYTDRGGRYEVAGLVPGTYAVTFDGGHARTIERLIVVHAATRTIVDVYVPVDPRAPLTAIEREAEPSERGILRTVPRETFDSLPVPAFFASVGALIPGMQVGGAGLPNYQDAGGSVGNAQNTLAIHGGRANDQMVLLDGMNVGLWNQSAAASALALPDQGVAETAISYGAHDASVETGGVAVILVPRSGSNAYRADAVGSLTGGALQWNNAPTSVLALGLPAQTRVKAIADVNPTLGGPVWRDHAWFFTSVRVRRRDLWLPVDNSQSASEWVYIPTTRSAVDDERQWTIAENATVRLHKAQTLTASYRDENQCDCEWDLAPGDAPETALHAVFSTHVVQGAWRAPFGGHSLAEAGASWLRTTFDASPQPDAVAPAAIDTGLSNMNIRSRAAFGPAGYQLTNNDDVNLFGVMTHATGSGSWRVGTTIERGTVRSNYSSLGDYTVQLENGLPLRVVYLASPAISIEDLTRAGVFAEYRWTTSRATVYAGGRFDRLSTGVPALTEPATSLLPALSFPAQPVLAWNDVSPRLSMEYDLSRSGRAVFVGSVSRYVLQQGLQLTQMVDRAGNARLVGDTRHWFDNFDYVPDGNPADPSANGELGPSTNATFGNTPPPFRINSTAANGWNVRPAQWEFAAGIQGELRSGVSAATRYVRRIYTNFTAVQDANVSAADFEGPYCITAPVDARLPGGGGNAICGLYDLSPAAAARPVDNVIVPASAFGAEREHWDGLDVTASVRVGRGSLFGGVSVGRTMVDTCALAGTLGSPSQLYCHVASPPLADARAQATWPLPLGTRGAVTLQSSPGLGSANGVAAIYEYINIPALDRAPSEHGGLATVNLIPPGTRFGDRVNQINARIARAFHVGSVALDARIDMYNVLNAATTLTWNNQYGGVAGSVTWLAPQSAMQGRLVEFSLRISQ